MEEPIQEDEKKFLTKDQVKELLERFVADNNLGDEVLIRLLYNGITLREIGHIRAKDIRPIRSNGILVAGTVRLRKPDRKIHIDPGTYDHCIQLINVLNLGKSHIKIFKIQYRRIEQKIKDMRQYLDIDFDLTPKVMNNTFFILKLSDPSYKSWTWEDYQYHLGWAKKDYTISQLEYFKKKVQELDGGNTNVQQK